MPNDFTPDEEDQIYREFAEQDQRLNSSRVQSSATLAKTVGDFYRMNPDMNPGVILAASKAYQSGAMSLEQYQKLSMDLLRREADVALSSEPSDKNKSWWERNVAGPVTQKLKTASRWTFAGLNFVPQFVQGGIGQIFDDNDSVAGWFISTDLGSLIENDEVAGEGFFIGGRAAELQAERARRYRGEIDGKAFTIGRGVATLVTQPGSTQYSIVSGLLDASAAVFTPSAPGAKVVSGAAKATGASTGLTRSLAGLADFETGVIRRSKVKEWLDSSAGSRVIDRIAKIETIDEAIRIFPKVQDTNFWIQATDLKTAGEVRTFLDETLGLTGPSRVSDINIGRASDVVNNRIGERFSYIRRMMAKVPGQHLVLQVENQRDAVNSVNSLNNYLKLIQRFGDEATFSDSKRIELVDRFARAINNAEGDVYQVVEEFDDLLRQTLIAQGVPEEALADLTKGLKQFKDNPVYGYINDLGDPDNMGAKFVTTDAEIADGPLATAVLESEELNNPLMLPDPRRVRRMMSEVGWIYGKGTRLSDPTKYRELRMPFAAMEFFQNEVWRPIVLATGGYALRNMSDSAIRQSLAPGLRTGIYHPLEWIQVALYKKLRGDLEGNPFKGTPEELLQSGQDEFAQAVSQGLRERMDPVTLERRGLRKNVWKRVRRSDGTAYRKGLQDEVSLLSEDRAAALVAGGQTNDEIIELMKTDPGMKEYVRRLQNRWRNRTVTDVDGNKAVKTVEFVRADGTLNEANLNEFLNKYVRERINRVTGNDQRLISIIASEGSAITLADGTTISPFVTGAGGRRIGYSDSFNTAADEIIADGNIKLKDTYKTKVEVDAAVDARYRGKQRNKVFEGMDRTVDLLFGSLYPKREAFLNRSPAFRQFYYNQIDNLLDELAPGEARKIIDNLREAAKDSGAKYTDKWAARYLGDGDLYQRIVAKAKGEIPSNGKLSLNEVSAYAKGYALDETQKLFYNVAQNSNFADIFRVVSPFGSAWADVISTWTRLATQNPDNLKRLGVSVKGLRDADPDNDGKGFFWRDPTTGEYVFNYPYSEKIGPLASYLGGMGALTGGVFGGKKGALIGGAAGLVGGLAGEKALGIEGLTLTAPARSLNMGLNIVPGVGPFVQVGANRILGNIPQADDVRKILAPYGEPELTLLPSWAQKVVAALDDPDNNRLLGDMMIDTMRVLSMTGKYDLSNPADVEELENDARGKARGLLLLRALGQFTGPTRPDIEFKTETFQGDMYMAELSKAFRDMQTQNYDTAVERFLLTFGEDAFLYVSGKTKAEVGGLEASKEFGNFERNNTSLFNRYGDVAGYFAPAGSNFDYQVYLRQLESGDRTRIKPTDLVEEAQSLVGRSLYRSVVRQLGPNPNADQKDYLKQMRTILEDRFPGYATTPIDINRLPAQILQLEDAAFDPILADNKIAQAARLYFDARNRALTEAENRGFSTLGGKSVADLRGWLRDIGESLARQIPEFERLYDRVLFNEIDIDAGEI